MTKFSQYHVACPGCGQKHLKSSLVSTSNIMVWNVETILTNGRVERFQEDSILKCKNCKLIVDTLELEWQFDYDEGLSFFDTPRFQQVEEEEIVELIQHDRFDRITLIDMLWRKTQNFMKYRNYLTELLLHFANSELEERMILVAEIYRNIQEFNNSSDLLAIIRAENADLHIDHETWIERIDFLNGEKVSSREALNQHY